MSSSTPDVSHANRRHRVLEATGFGALLLVTCALSFEFWTPFGNERTPHYPLAYLVVPPLVWASLQFEKVGAFLSLLVVSLAAMVSTAHGLGPFARDNFEQSALLLLSFLAIIGATTFLVSKRVARNRQTETVLRDSETRKSAMYEAALDCIVSMDSEGRVLEWNEAAEKTFGYEGRDVRGEQLSELIIPPAARLHHHRGLQHYLQSGEGPLLRRKVEVNAMRSDGVEFPVELAIAPVHLQDRVIFTGYLRDLTEAKRAEADLRAARDELELRVIERTAELQALLGQLENNYSQLQASELQRDSLTSMIVHDLRTPLTSLLFGLQTLGWLGSVNDAQQECLTVSVEGAKASLSMINDLLDIQKMEQGALLLETSDVFPQQLVENAIAQIDNLVKFSNLSISREFGAMPVLQGDEPKLQRVLVNPISNAIQHSPRESVVTVSVGAHNHDGVSECVWRVRDMGKGIAPEDHAIIFEKFGQAKTQHQIAVHKNGAFVNGAPQNVTAEKAHEFPMLSTGLGLAFCKMVIEAHGGRLWVESEMGAGSTFSFALPMSNKIETE